MVTSPSVRRTQDGRRPAWSRRPPRGGMCPKRCSGGVASWVTFLLGHLPDEVDNGEAPAVHIPLGVERRGPVRGAAAVRALFSCSGNSASLIVTFRPRIVRTAPSWRWSVSVCAARVRTAPMGSVRISLSLASKGTRILPRGGGATGMGGAAWLKNEAARTPLMLSAPARCSGGLVPLPQY
jgi:hypothetical protein